jgi:hypothetical protein
MANFVVCGPKDDDPSKFTGLAEEEESALRKLAQAGVARHLEAKKKREKRRKRNTSKVGERARRWHKQEGRHQQVFNKIAERWFRPIIDLFAIRTQH